MNPLHRFGRVNVPCANQVRNRRDFPGYLHGYLPLIFPAFFFLIAHLIGVIAHFDWRATNRFYSVHPRRNDRFVGPSTLMKSIFRDIDFTEFHFTRHMLNHLKALAPERFDIIRDELQSAWVARMKLLLSPIDNRVILLWFSARHPGEDNNCADLAQDPAFVTRAMLDAVKGRALAVVKVCASPLAKAKGTKGMVFSELEANAAAELLGPMVHEEAARALVPVIKKVLV